MGDNCQLEKMMIFDIFRFFLHHELRLRFTLRLIFTIFIPERFHAHSDTDVGTEKV